MKLYSGNAAKKCQELYQADQYDKANIYKMILHIVRGLRYLHSINIIHGDLALRNILIKEVSSAANTDYDPNANNNWIAVITDFGLSHKLKRLDGNQNLDVNQTQNLDQIFDGDKPDYASSYYDHDAQDQPYWWLAPEVGCKL